MDYGYQIHGYRSGHQCLFSTINLTGKDQDVIDRLSDISGQLKPGETFKPYLTCYKLPSNGFFVVARTWQDLDAPRAGCVITKSIVLPMELWLNDDQAIQSFNILLNASSDKDEPLKVDERYNDKGSPLLQMRIDGPLNELTEAIFLENRQPILYFNTTDSEAIVYRLYNVFWRKLKSTFSICTFALSQRTIEGRPFDLLFAPLSAKPRFSEWPGRRIDGIDAPPRHRWTTLLVNSIFTMPYPFLLPQTEELPHNIDDAQFDENSLRLNLLWEELMQNARSEDPYLSVLGLLDIANSDKTYSKPLRKKVDPLVYSSIASAFHRLTPLDSWNFYTSLLLRYKKQLMDREMYDTIKYSCERLSKGDPGSALGFIANYKRSLETIPALLFTGIGDGISAYFQDEDSSEHLSFTYFNSKVSIRLAAASEQFSGLIVNKLDNDKYEWDQVFNQIITSETELFKTRAVKNLSLHINQKTKYNIVERLFESLDAKTFDIVLKAILRKNHFKLESFNPIFLHNAIRVNKEYFIYDLLTRFDRNGESDDLLASIVAIEPQLFTQLCWNDVIREQRKAKIFTFLFSQPYEKPLKVLRNNRLLSLKVLNILNVETTSERARSIVAVSADLPSDVAVDELNKISEACFKQIGRNRTEKFISRLIENGPLNLTDSIINILRIADSFDYHLLFDQATRSDLTATQILRNINLLFKINPSFNRFLSENVNVISWLLSQKLNDTTITTNIANRWVAFLKQSENFKKAYKEAAVSMLDFSFRCNNFDPTPLIVASFPIVYNSFAKNKPITHFLPMLFFSDWDKCKTLREDLVKLYMNKPWSPFGLICVAAATDIIKEIVRLLTNNKNAAKFLEDAITEGRKNPKNEKLIEMIFDQI